MDAASAANHSPRADRMRITEIYASIHGESQYAGVPCTLVRTTGCDLRCNYCDTTYAFTGGKEMSIVEILGEVERLGLPFVLLTGGEPMLQKDLPVLAAALLTTGRRVAIETSGAHALDSLPEATIRIVDVKTPSSGESGRMRWDILASLRVCDAAKFVLVDEADYRWSAEVVTRLALSAHTEVLFSPVHGRLDPRELVKWLLRDHLLVRVNLQLHKYLWGADARGV
jgi:7-carboxy-7-deazaguanine synthase